MRTVIAHVVQVHYVRSGVRVGGWVGGGAWHAVAKRDSRYGRMQPSKMQGQVTEKPACYRFVLRNVWPCEHPHGQKIILLCTPHAPLPSACLCLSCLQNTFRIFAHTHQPHRVEFRKSLLACTRSTTCKTALQPVRPRCNDCNVTTSQHCTLDSVCRSACAWRSNAHAAQLSMSFSCNLCCGHCLDLFSLATMQHGVRTGGCGGCRRGVCSA
jgi:hypothetical protein